MPQEAQEARFRLEPNDDYWGGPWPKQKALYEELDWEYAGRLDLLQDLLPAALTAAAGFQSR